MNNHSIFRTFSVWLFFVFVISPSVVALQVKRGVPSAVGLLAEYFELI